MIGQTLNNRYKILSLLGRGGMGEVYLANDEQTKGRVAVKILARQLTSHPEALERFRREAKTLRQVEHPNIVKFIDAFEHDEQFVIVMEYVGGGSLFDLLKEGALPIERARQVALDLCDALIRAHRLNIIHRDIKPENVLLDENGTPKLADFGVARLNEGTRMTRSGTQVGTPHYMPPEAWEGKELDAQADIWSLGVMLFEMLSGQFPFDGNTPPMVMNKIFTSELPDLKKLRKDVPNDLVQIVKRMLAKDKSERYKTMRQVAVDLESGEQVITSKPKQPAKPTRIVTPKTKFDFSRYRVVFIFGVVIIGILIAINFLPSLDIPTQPTIQNTQIVIGSPTNTKVSLTNTPIPVTSTPELGIGSTMVSEKDSMTLVFVPAGEFIMGSEIPFEDEKPIHTINLNAFWIDQTEITNSMYAKCVNENKCDRPSSENSSFNSGYFSSEKFVNYPVINVSWNDAKTYCEWAGKRLPSEAEWEKAARGPNGSKYPWGNTEPKDIYLNYDTNIVDTSAVGSFPAGASIYGALDMAGNVSEWVSSLYKPYPYDAKDGREDLQSFEFRVLRGGSWYHNDPDIVRSSYRGWNDSTSADNLTGFRCALSTENASSSEQPNQTSTETVSTTPANTELPFLIGEWTFSENDCNNNREFSEVYKVSIKDDNSFSRDMPTRIYKDGTDGITKWAWGFDPIGKWNVIGNELTLTVSTYMYVGILDNNKIKGNIYNNSSLTQICWSATFNE